MPSAKPQRVLIGLAVLFVLALLPILLTHQGTGPKVVVYTAHNQDVVDALLPRFRQQTGIEVEALKLGSGEVIQRVLAERENPHCDVIWSIAGGQLQAHSELLEDYRPAAWEQLEETFRVGDKWLPYTGIVVCFVVNKDLVGQALPRPLSWSDLSQPALQGKISSARADKSGSSYMQLATVLKVHGAEGWSLYEGILKNLRFTLSSSAVPRLVNDGEAAVGITLEDNALRYVKGGGPVEIVYPQDGTSAAPDGIALVRGAPHQAEARAFIDWALSKETQDYLVQEMGRRPVRKDGQTPPGLPPLSEIKTVPYDFSWAAEHKDEWLKRWTALMAELGQ